MLTILGPTASGKTALAVEVALRIGGEILSADSRQVFRGMDLGTGKDRDEYLRPGGRKVEAHLIDIASPGEDYNIYRYQHDFLGAYNEIVTHGHTPILCGGSGLYAECVLKGYQMDGAPRNEALRARLEAESSPRLEERLRSYGSRALAATPPDLATNRRRTIRAIERADYYSSHPMLEATAGDEWPHIESLNFCLRLPAAERWQRIRTRLEARLKAGLEDEVKALIGIPGAPKLTEGVSTVEPEKLMSYGLEYKYVTLYVLGRMKRQDMIENLYIAIRQFAKRQMTWFRGMERRGLKLEWIDAGDGATPATMTERIVERWMEWQQQRGS